MHFRCVHDGAGRMGFCERICHLHISIFGFFSSAATPTANEYICLIAGPDMFNFGFGQSVVFMGVGWAVGAPAAGSVITQHLKHTENN